MPQPNNVVLHQQWQTCERCGFLYPMGKLTKQKGLLVCTQRCYDNLEVERRPWVIEQVLTTGGATDQEGLDTRQIDRGFFDGFDETQY